MNFRIGGRVEFAGNIYADVDYRYARTNDLVTMANGRVMLVELVLNVIAIWIVCFQG